MLAYLIEGIKGASIKSVHLTKEKRLPRLQMEILSWLSKNLHPCTNLDLDSLEEKSIPAINFISQSAPDIWVKLQKFDKEPGTPISDLVDVRIQMMTAAIDNTIRAQS
jgi:hypothetical protein